MPDLFGCRVVDAHVQAPKGAKGVDACLKHVLNTRLTAGRLERGGDTMANKTLGTKVWQGCGRWREPCT